MEKTYLKLGGTATTYVDQKNVISVSGKEVIEIDSAVALASKSISNALSRGHLVKATEEDFKGWQEQLTKDAPSQMTAAQVLSTLKAATPGSGDPSVAAGAASNDNPANKANPQGLTGNSGNVAGTDVKNDQTGTEDDDEDDDALSNSEMIDAIKEVKKAPADLLKNLTKLSDIELAAAYKKYGTK